MSSGARGSAGGGGGGASGPASSSSGLPSASANRYHLTSGSGSRTPRVFPPDVQSIPLSPSKLESSLFRERVTTLMQQGDAYAKKLDAERRRARELNAVLSRLRAQHQQAHRSLCEATHAQQQKGVFTCTAPSANNGGDTAIPPLRTLENRLEKVLTRYNEVCNANKQLRDEIQTLRREKVQQQQVHDKLERETHAKSSEIAKVTAAAQAAGDARDRALRQIETLRSQLDEDGADFEAGWQERAVQLEQDRAGIRDIPRLRTPKPKSRPHLLSDAGSPMSSMASPMSSNQPSGRTDGSKSTSSSIAGFKLLSTPELKLRDETIKNVWLLNEKESDLRRQSERLRAAEDGLAKIKRKTGMSDADDLARALLAAEEKNFSLFNMINELNTEMEAVEVENNALEEVVAQCRGSGRSSDSYRRELKQRLEDQIHKSKQKVSFLESRHCEATDGMEAMKAGAMSIFHKVGQSDEAFTQQLAAHGLTDVTLAKMLGIIEQRVGELVDMHNLTTAGTTVVANGTAGGNGINGGGNNGHLHHHGNGASDAGGHHKGKFKPGGHHASDGAATNAMGGALLRLTPPTADDFNDPDPDDGDDIVRPCKIADIQEKTAAAVGRRKEKQIRFKR